MCWERHYLNYRYYTRPINIWKSILSNTMINKDKSKKTSHVHSEEVITLYQSLTKTITLMVVTAFTLVFVGVAWFVANSRVNSGTSQISTVFEPIKLAVSSKDFRQESEKNELELPEGHIFKDQEGNTYHDDTGNYFYYTNAETIALRLDKNDYEVSPGSKGKIEFYLIPGGGSSEIVLDIKLGAYGQDETGKVTEIHNNALTTMMNGHILLFDDYENGVYSNWLLKNDGNNNWTNSITVDLSGKEVGIPVKVDLYWIWPTRYKNMVNDFGGTGVYAFAESQADKKKMTSLTNNYRYSCVYLISDEQNLSSDSVRTEGYDQADEYIGSNAQYLYLEINTGNQEVQS